MGTDGQRVKIVITSRHNCGLVLWINWLFLCEHMKINLNLALNSTRNIQLRTFVLQPEVTFCVAGS